MKTLLFLLLLLGGVGAGYWWFAMQTEPVVGSWPLDLAEVRKAARSVEGPLPDEVRVEKMAGFDFMSAVVVTSGDWKGWSPQRLSIYAYQLVFPKRTVIIDTGVDEQTAKGELPIKEYDAQAWWRVQRALNLAEFAVVTHERFDHMGGLLDNPAAWAKALVTAQQLQPPEAVKPLKYPAGKPKSVLDYQGMQAVAPGVVLIRAPGYSPGGQMVYVQRADGVELLFLGDVAWSADNIERVRERPRAVSLVLEEDRAAVLRQLAALKALRSSEPKLNQVPGHDPVVVDALVSQGVLKAGFITKL